MYVPCQDCGSLVSCYCFTPGRFIEDTFSEALHKITTTEPEPSKLLFAWLQHEDNHRLLSN